MPTHYLEHGAGQPVILIHGGGAGADSHGNWRDVIPAPGEGFHVIALRAPGDDRASAGFRTHHPRVRPVVTAAAVSERLRAAERTREPCAPVATMLGGDADALDEAYLAQTITLAPGSRAASGWSGARSG